MDKDTKKIISIAEKPSTFGVEFHNKGYELLGINQIYIPLKVLPDQLESIVQLVKDNFNGCSVSMPHKINIMDYLDSFDRSATACIAVNTVVKQEDGSLYGYNTDYYGAKRAIQEKVEIKDKDVVMVGAGGVARAIGKAVIDLGGRLKIFNRTYDKGNDLAKKLGADVIGSHEDLFKTKGKLIINATSVGMFDHTEIPFHENILDGYEAVMDVVGRETKLIYIAGRKNKITIRGRSMTTYQAARQFELYTNRTLPDSFLKEMLGE